MYAPANIALIDYIKEFNNETRKDKNNICLKRKIRVVLFKKDEKNIVLLFKSFNKDSSITFKGYNFTNYDNINDSTIEMFSIDIISSFNYAIYKFKDNEKKNQYLKYLVYQKKIIKELINKMKTPFDDDFKGKHIKKNIEYFFDNNDNHFRGKKGEMIFKLENLEEKKKELRNPKIYQQEIKNEIIKELEYYSKFDKLPFIVIEYEENFKDHGKTYTYLTKLNYYTLTKNKGTYNTVNQIRLCFKNGTMHILFKNHGDKETRKQFIRTDIENKKYEEEYKAISVKLDENFKVLERDCMNSKNNSEYLNKMYNPKIKITPKTFEYKSYKDFAKYCYNNLSNTIWK